jgi:hypothetical protein
VQPLVRDGTDFGELPGRHALPRQQHPVATQPAHCVIEQGLGPLCVRCPRMPVREGPELPSSRSWSAPPADPGLDRMLLEARRAPRPLLPPGLRRDGAQRRVFVSGFRPCVVPLPRLSSRRSVFGEQFGEWVGFGLGEAYTGAVGVGGVEVEDGDGAEGAAALGCEGVLGADVGGGVVSMGTLLIGASHSGGCPVAAAVVGRCGV